MIKILQLRCAASLARELGAIEPQTLNEYRKLRDAGHMLVRDHETPAAFFWPLVEGATVGSSQ